MASVLRIFLLSTYSFEADAILYILVNPIITAAVYCTPTILYIYLKGDKITEKGGKRFVLISCIVCWVAVNVSQGIKYATAKLGQTVFICFLFGFFLWYCVASAIMHAFLKKHGKVSAPPLKNDMFSSYKQKDVMYDEQMEDNNDRSVETGGTVEELTTQEKALLLESIKQDRARYLELKEELKKFPVQKIKQWYAEGKLTEEQYKASARKYNAIRKEMNEIKERVEQINTVTGVK